jgi:hypothetical protein
MPMVQGKGRGMPGRKRSATAAGASVAGGPVKSFRQRYDDLEKNRAALVERLERHAQAAQTHPSVKRARKLLTSTFRNAKLAQRAAILQAAEWLICLIERTPPVL